MKEIATTSFAARNTGRGACWSIETSVLVYVPVRSRTAQEVLWKIESTWSALDAYRFGQKHWVALNSVYVQMRRCDSVFGRYGTKRSSTTQQFKLATCISSRPVDEASTATLHHFFRTSDLCRFQPSNQVPYMKDASTYSEEPIHTHDNTPGVFIGRVPGQPNGEQRTTSKNTCHAYVREPVAELCINGCGHHDAAHNSETHAAHGMYRSFLEIVAQPNDDQQTYSSSAETCTLIRFALMPSYPIPSTISGRNVVKAVTGKTAVMLQRTIKSFFQSFATSIKFCLETLLSSSSPS
ncbi:hypothetical protein KC363_g72 [Hortaea werneckii]|nr:hypothetical protein KC363_g72 [Hortaea werneckii]